MAKKHSLVRTVRQGFIPSNSAARTELAKLLRSYGLNPTPIMARGYLKPGEQRVLHEAKGRRERQTREADAMLHRKRVLGNVAPDPVFIFGADVFLH